MPTFFFTTFDCSRGGGCVSGDLHKYPGYAPNRGYNTCVEFSPRRLVGVLLFLGSYEASDIYFVNSLATRWCSWNTDLAFTTLLLQQ